MIKVLAVATDWQRLRLDRAGALDPESGPMRPAMSAALEAEYRTVSNPRSDLGETRRDGFA
jgi:hypothetical protein